MTQSFDVLPCGYLSFKDNGIVLASNTTLATWLGYSKEQLVGESVEKIFTLATRIFYNTHFFPLIRLHSKASEIFLSLKTRENEDIPVLANAKRILEDSDYVIHCIFVRIEERKKYEQELLNAKREAESALKENKQLLNLTKSLEQQTIELDKQYQHQIAINENLLQFSKIISHDLQEPIRKIQILIDLISRDPDTTLSAKGKTNSRKIDATAEKLRILTRSLQEYITVDNDKTYTAVDLNATIERARSRAVKLRQFSDFDIQLDKMPTIEGHEKQLELLFFHLIDNAIQYRSPIRKLAIKVSQLVLQENIFRVSKDLYKYTDHLRISFEDNGIGIAEEYSDYVFHLLNKLDNATSGLGIGLPLVKKIVQNHSGEIRLKSQSGTGTRFEIELPLTLKG